MSPLPNRSVTLIELTIALCILGILVLAFTSIDLFSRYHVRDAEFRAELQNEISSILDHICKTAVNAIGDVANPAKGVVAAINGQPGIFLFIDANNNGLRDAVPPDRVAAYTFGINAGVGFGQTRYYPNYNNNAAAPGAFEILGNRLRAYSFTPDATNLNIFRIDLSVCWDINQIQYPCGALENPIVQMYTSANMPSVSSR